MAQRIVYTGGTWDLFHAGHLNVLKKARDFGDYVVVGVSTDDLVSSYKNHPPVLNWQQRSSIIKELKCVDEVVPQERLFDIDQFMDLGCDVFIVGDDWKGKEGSVSNLKWLKDNGYLRYVEYTPGLSSSLIKEKIMDDADNIRKSLISRKISEETR
ncbi:adenylyltransferase/cytidyltransferase family protein [Vreelandella arctica]|uniref:adenylyltransferase/cytidyltransferase family protein n=1 Tax=Vreelandella arctica TaxID=3126499 RepID=UPI00300E4CDD